MKGGWLSGVGGFLDEQVRFRHYRRDGADTLMYCFYIIGDLLVSIIFDQLVSYSFPSTSWQSVEAALFCLKSLSDVCSTHVYTAKLLPIFSLFTLSFSTLHPRVTLVCINLFGSTFLCVLLMVECRSLCGMAQHALSRFHNERSPIPPHPHEKSRRYFKCISS